MSPPSRPAAGPVVVVGGGGHGREVIDTLAAMRRAGADVEVAGVVDDALAHPERLERLGVRWLGPIEWLADHPAPYVVGIGTSAVRGALVERFDRLGLTATTVVHPAAHVGLDVELGDGVVVFDRSTITTDVRIGRHTHLNVGCAVQHDTVVGDFVQFSPGVLVNGDCTIGDHVFLGTGAVVTRGCTVGAGARVGAGAVVLDDVAPGTTVMGIPARSR